MSSYGSIWVKLSNPETDLPALRAEFNPNAVLSPCLTFACAIKDDSYWERRLKAWKNYHSVLVKRFSWWRKRQRIFLFIRIGAMANC